jgi:plasmid stabilization system protein ParE
MRYEFHPEALNEFEEAARYYSRRQPGLESRFVASVREAVDRILEDPTRWRAFDDDVRRCFPHVFPFGILYTIERDYVLIVAVAHCSRKPGYWKDRRSR